MSSKHTPEETLAKLDMTEIAYAMSQLALKMLSGKKVEQEEFDVKISIPKEIADVFQQLADAAGTPIEKLLSDFTKEGFNAAVRNRLEGEKDQPASATPEVANDLEQLLPHLGPKLVEGINKIKEMAEKLGGLQEAMEDVNIPKAETNNQQSDVPTGSEAERETGK